MTVLLTFHKNSWRPVDQYSVFYQLDAFSVVPEMDITDWQWVVDCSEVAASCKVQQQKTNNSDSTVQYQQTWQHCYYSRSNKVCFVFLLLSYSCCLLIELSFHSSNCHNSICTTLWVKNTLMVENWRIFGKAMDKIKASSFSGLTVLVYISSAYHRTLRHE